jgi:hypothetical protein
MINDSGDDRANIQVDDKVVLIVEDDLAFWKDPDRESTQ